MALVDSSWAAQRIVAEQSAVDEVRNLDRREFSNPALGGTLDRIASRYSLEVATLEPSAMSGSRKDTQRVIRDEFGMTGTATFTVMEVKIPFRGDPLSFRLSPTCCTIPQQICEVSSDHLLVTLTDDADVQKKVDQFVQQVAQNLSALKTEVEGWRPRLRALLDQVASVRMKEIAAQKERDKNLNFKVD